MKRDDLIFRYLSDLMTEAEKIEFEKELSKSGELKDELKKEENLLESINSCADIKSDSAYFQNLLPRVREKLEKKKRIKLAAKFAYLIPVSAALILILLNTGKFLNETPKTAGAEISAEIKSSDTTDAQYLMKKFNIASVKEIPEFSKNEGISFEVGVSDIAAKEAIKEVAKKRFSVSINDYLLAIR